MKTKTATFTTNGGWHEQLALSSRRCQGAGIVGIWHGGEEYVAGFGVTNVNHPLPVDGDTLFQIGSTTKTLTATVAMCLVEAGQLDLDAPIRTYLPDFQLQDEAAAAQATLRHCFTHTGGWVGDYFDDTGDGDDALAIYVQRMAQLPQQAPLGTLWSYNNAGFSLAGRVIEAVTGKPFETVAQEFLLQPLGMEHSYFFAKDVMVHRFAVGHLVDEAQNAKVAQPWALARSAHAAGGITSSARDQLRYARFHLGDGHAADGASILQPATMRAMQTQCVSAYGLASGVGVSWLLHQVGATQVVGHGGATNGQISAFQLVPTHNFAITSLTNANRGREFNRDLVAWALDHFLGLRDPAPVLQTRSAAALQEYTGFYVAPLSHAQVSIVGDGLQIQVIPQSGFPLKDSPPAPQPPPAPAAFVAQDRFIVTAGPMRDNRGEFIRDAQGGVAWIHLGGRAHAKE
jgi:CubicO group peptidase (beta-lactamase class C family)